MAHASGDRKFNYEWNKPLSNQYLCVLRHWCRVMVKGTNSTMAVPDDIYALVIEYSQFASDFMVTENLVSDTLSSGVHCANAFTFRTQYPFPLNQGIYSFHVRFTKRNSNGDTCTFSAGEDLGGLNFVGICSSRFAEFEKYVLETNKTHIYGFGDGNESETWRYFGDGNNPSLWNRRTAQFLIDGGFGHADTMSIVVNMDKEWIRVYKNGQRYVDSEFGDIRLRYSLQSQQLLYYPVISMSMFKQTEVTCTITFGHIDTQMSDLASDSDKDVMSTPQYTFIV